MTCNFNRAGQRRTLRSPHRRGMSLIIVALLLTVLLGIVGLALDTLYGVRTAQQLQAAADAAALAGAALVRGDPNEAVAQAVAVGAANTDAGEAVELVPSAGYLDGDVVIGRFDREDQTFEPTLSNPNAVKVRAQRSAANPAGALALAFGPIFGVRTIDVSRDAIATIGGGTGAGLIVLNEHACSSLSLQGSASINVLPGAIQVNSDCATAIGVTGGNGIELDAEAINVVGGVSSNFSKVNTYDSLTPRHSPAPLNTGAEPIADPLAFLRDHPYTNRTLAPAHTGNTYYPGYYPNGLTLTGTMVLNPGVYVLGSPGLTGKGTMTAHGVMFYIIGGSVNLGGNAQINLTPLDDGSMYTGMAIWQAYTNIAEATLQGGPSMNLQGTIYFPANLLHLGGTPGSMGNQLIVDRLAIDGGGHGVLRIAYDGRNPAPGNKVFLVE